jgi:tetratricopeptide (TPR) repeat protein
MRFGLILPALLASLSWSARADSLDEARAHLDRANAEYALGNYDSSAAEFEKSFQLKPDPALLYNAAQAQRLAGNKSRARLLYQNLLRVYGDRISNSAEIRRHIAELNEAITSDEKTQTSPPVTPIAAGAAGPATPAPSPPVSEPPKVQVVVAPTLPVRRPLAKRAWVWGTIAGAALVVGAGVALGVTLGARSTVPSYPLIGTAGGN